MLFVSVHLSVLRPIGIEENYVCVCFDILRMCVLSHALDSCVCQCTPVQVLQLWSELARSERLRIQKVGDKHTTTTTTTTTTIHTHTQTHTFQQSNHLQQHDWVEQRVQSCVFRRCLRDAVADLRHYSKTRRHRRRVSQVRRQRERVGAWGVRCSVCHHYCLSSLHHPDQHVASCADHSGFARAGSAIGGLCSR